MLADAGEEIEDLNRLAQRAGTIDTICNLLDVSKSAQSFTLAWA
jgi:hypothetical protein